MATQIIVGDCREKLRDLPDASVHCCVTSPPYFGLRDYGHDGQMGLEPTPDEFVAGMVGVFREVRRVLRDDGTLWLNIGDSYGAGKQLIGVPWRLALALQTDGWVLRQDIIWSKPNAMPESASDRCTKGHEYLFLLSKQPRYYYDADAIVEPATWERWGKQTEKKHHTGTAGHLGGKTLAELPIKDTKNKRSVWTVPTQPYGGGHFAAYPPALIEPCILAGCPRGGTVLDPFFGAGTTGLVADRLGRNCIGIELNEDYVGMALKRIQLDGGMFADVG